MAGPVVLDVNVEPRYDTTYIPAAGSQQIQFFAQPIGTGASVFNPTGSSKTLAETNMDLQGQLAAGNSFQVQGFRLMPTFNISVADATLAFNAAVFVFTLGSKDFIRVPVRTIPAGGGVVSATTTVASLGWQVLTNGYKIGNHPIILSPTQNFGAKILWPAGGQAVTTSMAGGTTVGVVGLPITCFLDGFLSRLPQ